MNAMKKTKLLVGTVIGCMVTGQAMATILFSEDWESHSPGAAIQSANGWTAVTCCGEPTSEISVQQASGGSPAGMSGNYANGSAGGSNSTGGYITLNPAGIGSGLDPTKEYILSWTWYNSGDKAHGPEFGFAHSGHNNFGTRLTLEGGHNGNAGRSRLLSRNNGEDGAGWPGDGVSVEYEIRMTKDSVSGWRDGSQTAGAGMDEATFVGHDGIYWFADFSGSTGRNAGDIDNITLRVVPEPATLGLLALGGMIACFRRRG